MISSQMKGQQKMETNTEIAQILRDLNLYERAVQSYNKKYSVSFEILNEINKAAAYREGRRLFRFAIKIANKIDEFIKSGNLESAQREWCEQTWETIQQLGAIEGVGNLRAGELVEAGISRIEDLFYHTDLLTRQQIIGLEYYCDLRIPIPRLEIEHLGEAVGRLVTEWRPDCKMVICGGFRRGKKQCDAVKILLETPNPSSADLTTLVLRMRASHLLLDTFCTGEAKFSGVCRVSSDHPVRRLHVRVAPQKEMPFALLHLTGPRLFIEKLMRKALDQRFYLNEYSIRRLSPNGTQGPPVIVESENAVFELISAPFVAPEDRK